MTSYRGFTCLDNWTFTSEYATCNNAYFNRNPEKENILEQKTLLECQTACTDNGQCKAMHYNSEKQQCTIYTHSTHAPFVFSFHDSHAHVLGIRDCTQNYSKQECLSIDNASEITDVTLPTGCIRISNNTHWNNETSATTNSFTNKPQNITCAISSNNSFPSKQQFKIVSSNGTCEDVGMHSITSSNDCQQAYNYLRDEGTSTLSTFSEVSGNDSRCLKTGQAITFSPLLETYNETFVSLYEHQMPSTTPDSDTSHHYNCDQYTSQEAIENACNADDQCKGYTIESQIVNDVSFTQFSGPNLNGSNVPGNCNWPLGQTFWENDQFEAGTNNCRQQCESSDDCKAYVQASSWCVVYNACREDSSGSNWNGNYFRKNVTPRTVLNPKCLVTDTTKDESHKLFKKPSPSFCGSTNSCICKWSTGATENAASNQNDCQSVCDEDDQCNGFSYNLNRGCELYSDCTDETNEQWGANTIWKEKQLNTTYNKDLVCGVKDSKCLCKYVSLAPDTNFVAKIKI